MSLTFRTASHSDLESVKMLLQHYDLPSSDVIEQIEHFIVVFDENILVGVGGYELTGQIGLVRSFAVHPEYSGQGIAESIFTRLLSQAREDGIESFYLLTTTADGYFARLGFSVVSREEVPEAIKKTEQFSSLCPGSAIVMSKELL